MQKREAQLEYIHIAYTYLARFCPDLYAQSKLNNNTFALELGRKFIKSALLVGQAAPRLSDSQIWETERELEGGRGWGVF